MLFGQIYAELKTWQPVIGAVLGFGALTWGALYNYRLGRKRDDAIREKEALSVALGLYSEINLISNELARLANAVGSWFTSGGYSADGVPPHLSESFVLPRPTLFEALAPNVGRLSPKMLIPITRFYGYYGEATGHIPKILANRSGNISYGPEWFLEPAISAIDEVQSALREIELVGGIREVAPIPDLNKARKAMDLEKQLRPED